MGGSSSTLKDRTSLSHNSTNIVFIHRFTKPLPKGFYREGSIIHFSANKDDTVGDVLNKFNEYREPKDKLNYLFDKDGVEYRYTDSIALYKVYYV